MLKQLFCLGLILCNVGTGASISRTEINLRDYGAKGNGKTFNTKAFNDAIQACAAQGGGTVVVPAGIFLTGTVLLQSHVNLFLEKDAIIKGVSKLEEYRSYIPTKEIEKYDNADKYNWNRALILGVDVEDVTISGQGIIDDDHVLDPNGEENMRGPHTILFGESRNITLSDITILHAANYAFMAYDIENATFQHLTMKEGWDGIHIRGGKNILIRNSEFYTGDDAIAGGYWENMTITDCHINSSCNGIRMIMPATNLTIAHCTFQGPGAFPHRTSKERRRTNMLSAVLLQPGGWGNTPGRVDNVFIHDLTIDRVDNPLMFLLNQNNECGTIKVEHVQATRIARSASSVESWKGGTFQHIVFRDITIEYAGHNDPSLPTIRAGQPHVDARVLPCWGWFFHNVKQLTCENVHLSYTGTEIRPAFLLDNVTTATFRQVECREVQGVEPMLLQNCGELKNVAIKQFK
ncbi:glycoside hydrolase family 28 protein [Parabacteroides pacaensis]|uniref:glycoside hydrolase family 28 protein n=1 Tax=Parabacteroides pacaensis TaxID=2086575 RepID=UPI00131BAA31|nr:glycosyl hydrolase family 28-related protein [Parabacteroides pacaensis]